MLYTGPTQYSAAEVPWYPLHTETATRQISALPQLQPRCKNWVFRQKSPKIPQHQQNMHNAQDQKQGLARNRTGVARTVQARSRRNEGSEPEVITATLRNR
jgi:hypothetical protein